MTRSVKFSLLLHPNKIIIETCTNVWYSNKNFSQKPCLYHITQIELSPERHFIKILPLVHQSFIRHRTNIMKMKKQFFKLNVPSTIFRNCCLLICALFYTFLLYFIVKITFFWDRNEQNGMKNSSTLDNIG